MREYSVTLAQAKTLIQELAERQSLLLLSSPGVGKSDIVRAAARDAGLPCRSLLGTQIAPEDVSGIPHIVGERSVFCPPRLLLPEDNQPFCLFLDELPAASPEIQKAFYSLLLERRIGEHPLPPGSWVVSAGNRAVDRSLVRSMSTALVNRVLVLNVKIDRRDWFVWAKANGIRTDILVFLTYMPSALNRSVPKEPVPFSTPRAWASMSRSLDLLERHGQLDEANRRALAFGRVSAEDAAIFCCLAEEQIESFLPIEEYFASPEKMPQRDTARWFIINQLRAWIQQDELPQLKESDVNQFLASLPTEFRFAVMVNLVDRWGRLGASETMLKTLKEVTGL